MPDLIVRLEGEGISAIPANAWDRCAGPDDPFLSHAFLSTLEESGSVGPGTGWQAAPLLIERPGTASEGADLLACAPLYFKTHSQGEYVFDHAWADAWHRAGREYYPKAQLSVPFTPATGNRLLLAPDSPPELAQALIGGVEEIVRKNGLSSAHATFVAPSQIALFEKAGWLIREDSQFHWENENYRHFDDFLAALSSAKRKTLRKERQRARQGLDIVQLTGPAIKPEHWDAFWGFYQDTGARKWGRPYLTRSFFDLIGQSMADRILLVLALRNGEPIAGALNLIGGDTLYGRYWGCSQDVPCLHFELCYYQAIDFAIARGLHRVEAGAQGGHKLARGYRPMPTQSAHYIADPGFRAAVAQFLEQERQAVSEDRLWLSGHTPFRKETPDKNGDR